jgi:uncharacterized protein YcbX
MRLASIHTYPVKGLHRVDRDSAPVEPWGLAGDRRWLLTDGDGRMLTQREEPALTQLQPSYVDGDLVVRAAGRPDLHVPAKPGDLVEVLVWRTPVLLSRTDPAADEWLSAALGREVRLMYLDDPTRRPVDPEYAAPADRVSLADGYPLLLANSASLSVLNDWILEDGGDEGPLPMTRFRPNVVVEGAPAWAEDGWIGRRLRIGPVTLRVPKPCGRCVVTTTDQETGERGREPLRTLARYRKKGLALLFAVNLIPEGTGDIRVGDPVVLMDRVF